MPKIWATIPFVAGTVASHKRPNVTPKASADICEGGKKINNPIDIALKKNEIDNLNKEIDQLRSLSQEKLLFSSIISEANLIYPDLNSFEIYETIRTDFQKTDTVVVVSVSWSDIIDDNNKLQLNQSIKNWIGFKFKSKNIEIVEKN